MPSPLPYFPFHTRDWLSSSSVLRMPPAARGVYITLLCVQWEDGILPEDQAVLAQMTGVPYPSEEWKTIWLSVGSCFVRLSHGLVNPRMQKDREYTLNKVNQLGENGRKGGRPRGKKEPEKTKQKPNGLANGNQMGNQIESYTDTDVLLEKEPKGRNRTEREIFAEFKAILPTHLNSRPVLEELAEVLKMRAERKLRPWLSRTVKGLSKAWGDYSAQEMIDALRNCRLSEHQGIFPKHAQALNGQHKNDLAAIPAEDRASLDSFRAQIAKESEA